MFKHDAGDLYAKFGAGCNFFLLSSSFHCVPKLWLAIIILYLKFALALSMDLLTVAVLLVVLFMKKISVLAAFI